MTVEDAVAKKKLSKAMTIKEFDNGYWYAVEIKAFAKTIGIHGADKLRKDELERAIKRYLKTGKSKTPTMRKLTRSGCKDIENGLTLALQVINYADNRETKDFIDKAALSLDPNFKIKSGARYRLNRWREEQLTNGTMITYDSLVKQYIELCGSDARFSQEPAGRYINFISDFLGANREATHKQARDAWKELKQLDMPKDYKAWKRYKKSRN